MNNSYGWRYFQRADVKMRLALYQLADQQEQLGNLVIKMLDKTIDTQTKILNK